MERKARRVARAAWRFIRGEAFGVALILAATFAVLVEAYIALEWRAVPTWVVPVVVGVPTCFTLLMQLLKSAELEHLGQALLKRLRDGVLGLLLRPWIRLPIGVSVSAVAVWMAVALYGYEPVRVRCEPNDLELTLLDPRIAVDTKCGDTIRVKTASPVPFVARRDGFDTVSSSASVSAREVRVELQKSRWRVTIEIEEVKGCPRARVVYSVPKADQEKCFATEDGACPCSIRYMSNDLFRVVNMKNKPDQCSMMRGEQTEVDFRRCAVRESESSLTVSLVLEPFEECPPTERNWRSELSAYAKSGSVYIGGVRRGDIEWVDGG